MEWICKKVTGALLVAWLMTFGVQTPRAMAQYDDVNVSYNDFYQNMAPYGQWIEDPQYGYVWSPNVDGSFRPYYTNGYWAMTDYGNTWVSDYPWGWAAFHYGRWTYDNYYGWLWIPGSNWGPAWVSWREGDGYYGWAPLGPGYEFGAGYVDYSCPNDWWVFIPPQYIFGGNYYRYWYGPRGNNNIITTTHVINNTYVTNNVTYVAGPQRSEIERTTHQPVHVYTLSRSASTNTRVHNNTIKMFRPAEIRPVAATGSARVTPPNVVGAPQPVRPAQPVNTGQSGTRTFHDDVPKNTGRNDQVGTNVSETAAPAAPHTRTTTQPYEWDVNRSVPQPDRTAQPEQPRQQNNYQPQPVRQQPAPAPQPQQPVRSQPMPSQPVRQQPMPPQQPRMQPAPSAPRPAPAPRQQGGRR